MERKYVSPSIEAIEVEVEEGFAFSAVEVTPGAQANDFTTNSFGPGGGGSTMYDW